MRTAMGIALTDVDTEAKFPLGETFLEPHPTYGERVWMYVKNAEASSSFVIGTIVSRKTATVARAQGVIAPTSSANSKVLGVAQHTIPAGSFGFILREGIGSVLADTGGITADTGIVPGNAVAGRADDASDVTVDTFGSSLAAIAAAATGLCVLNCRG